MSHKSLEERLDDIKHRKMDLTGTQDDPLDNDPHRPLINIWAEWNDDNGGSNVAVAVNALWAQQARYIDLMPSEARQLARDLIAMADAIDSVVDNYEPPDPPGFEAGFAANH